MRAGRVAITVDAHAVPDAGTSIGFVVAADVPRVVVQVPEGADKWQVLEAASGPIMEMSGRTAMTMHLRVRLIDLQRRCGAGTPTDEDVAAVLSLRAEEVTSLGEGLGDVSDVVPVLALVDLNLAEQLREVGRGLGSREELHSWLDERLGGAPISAEGVLRLADANDLRSAVAHLGVGLGEANASLRALGIPPLHNSIGHEREMAAYVSTRAPAIQNDLGTISSPRGGGATT